MANVASGVGPVKNRVYSKNITVKEKVKNGFLFVARETSQVMNDLYSMEGFEKGCKVIIAKLNFLNQLSAIKGVFNEALKTIQAQRDLYYVTILIGSLTDFIKIKYKEGKKRYCFHLPIIRTKTKDNDGKIKEKKEIDWVKILYAIGNFFETGKFLQRYVYPFKTCTQFANQLGSIKLFNFQGKGYFFSDIPIISSVCEKPKDLFIFLASIIEVKRCLKKPLLEWENALKLTGSIGKIVLISLGRYYYKEIWFSLIDMATQDASLIAFILKRRKGREMRFNRPGAAAAA